MRDTIPYAKTGYFGKSIIDYLNNDPKLEPFYGRRPEINSFRDQLEEKANSYTGREVLIKALRRQYSNSGLRSDSIQKLEDQNSFTVTTGHQVCLFTGPLYFLYKIVSVIKTTRELALKYPDYQFIPVFWMATEDHDFAEANHFFLPSGKIEWESGQNGAVGRMNTVGMDEVCSAMKEKLGIGYRSGELIELFEKAYLNHTNIAEATRYLVDRLFGNFGVISVDGDDPELKARVIPYFEREIREELSFKAVKETNAELGQNYSLQVTPREINLFYLEDSLRERIVRSDSESFEILHTELRFSEDEIIRLLHEMPERFSPNVVLRPLYQEVVLPNIAYIGGGGELNYWFQLKEAFKRFGVPFPILMLRNSAMVIDKSASRLMDALDLSVADLFQKSGMELEKELVRSESAETLELSVELEKLEDLFLEIEAKLRKVDKLLEKSVRSGYVRSERIVRNLEKKMLKAERKKHDILTSRLHKLREKLFPNDGLQERSMNFAIVYEEFGLDFVNLLIENLDPFSKEFTILRAE